MRRKASVLALLSLGSLGSAVQYDVAGFFAAQDSELSRFGVRAGIREASWNNYWLSAQLSTRAATLGLRRNVPLLGVGTASLNLTGGYAFAGGGRLGLDAAGSLGPVALSLFLKGWTTAPSTFYPLEQWDTGSFNTPSGYQLGAQARYRLRRDLTVTGKADWGSEKRASLEAEWRRDALSYRVGAALGRGRGLLAGLSYRNEHYTLSADTVWGSQLGLSAQLDAPLGNTSDLNAYASYQPWRTVPLRYGVGLHFSPSEQLSWRLRAVGGTGGIGAEVSVTFSPETTNPEGT